MEANCMDIFVKLKQISFQWKHILHCKETQFLVHQKQLPIHRKQIFKTLEMWFVSLHPKKICVTLQKRCDFAKKKL
jgi:hypothetical protein